MNLPQTATLIPATALPARAGLRALASARGFTLVELIIVMALLAIVGALAAPSLSGSIRQRNLKEEALRFLALTEYARDEAVSQGVPMVVWVDPNGQRVGVGPKDGFEGDESRLREFALNPDVSLKIDRVAMSGGVANAVEFSPDGAPGLESVETIELVDRFESLVRVARTPDQWAYEIREEGK